MASTTKMLHVRRSFISNKKSQKIIQVAFDHKQSRVLTTQTFFKNSYQNEYHFKERNASSFSTATSSNPIHISTNDKDKKEDKNDANKKNEIITTKEYVSAISELSKARLSALVVSTSTFGFLAGAVDPISYPTLVACSIGTALCSSSASTFNQIIETDRDKKMKRTAHRPLVTQRIVTTPTAIALACTTGLSGGAVLVYGTDPITASLGVGNIALYAGLYTYLKPRSEWNTWVGAIVGAIPPVMGYTAASNGGGLLDIEAALLGTTLFLWQFPHFFALSWMHRADYARGGFQMVATNDNERGDWSSRLITRYTYYLSTMPFLASFFDVTSSMFAIEGLALNGYALYVAKKFEKDRSNGNARKVFLTSLWYLPCWMGLFLLHSTKWKNSSKIANSNEDGKESSPEKVEEWIEFLKRKAGEVRNRGKELCLHEIVAFGDGTSNENDDRSSFVTSTDGDKSTTTNIAGDSAITSPLSSASKKCPIALGKSTAKLATQTTVEMTKISTTNVTHSTKD